MIVGLTGGIASGKSTVTNMLLSLGAYVVDADVWARKVVEVGTDGLTEVVAAFGKGILEPDGSLSRAALGQLIFSNPQARGTLNGIIHPRVRSGMSAETAEFLNTHPNDPIVWDVPLLFEGETVRLVDQTVVVYVDEQTQLQRLMTRNSYTREEAQARIAAQMPIEQKRKMATYVIDNSGELNATREQVQRIWQTIRGQKTGDRGSSF